jgi:hypothetical protein
MNSNPEQKKRSLTQHERMILQELLNETKDRGTNRFWRSTWCYPTKILISAEEYLNQYKSGDRETDNVYS